MNLVLGAEYQGSLIFEEMWNQSVYFEQQIFS